MTALDRQVEHLAVVFLQQLVTLRAQNQILELALFRITINSRRLCQRCLNDAAGSEADLVVALWVTLVSQLDNKLRPDDDKGAMVIVNDDRRSNTCGVHLW